MKLLHYWNGNWQKAASAEVIDLCEPATGAVLAQVPVATEHELELVAQSALSGFALWRNYAPSERARIILAACRLLRERLEDHAAEMSREQGKPLAEARAEVQRAAELMEWVAEEGRRTYGEIIPAPIGSRYLSFWEPIGPVLALTPWNFPMVSVARKVGSALAAGCSCILKPSELTPLSARNLVQAFHDAGLPAGVLSMVMGHPALISRYLLAHEAVRAVTFTGSVAVGKNLAAQAGAVMKPALMELGGHSPVIVFDDVDVEKVAAQAVIAKYRNSGQVCTSPTRFFVHAKIYDRFVAAFAKGAEALSLGCEGDGVMGPVVSERRRSALLELIDEAQACGARLVTGGQAAARPGSFLLPTVLADVPPQARVMNEEPFGPLAVFQPFESTEDVLTRANGLPYGLAAYCFTRSIAAGRAVVEGLNCGIVGLNSFSGSNPETPFGGVRDSGYGREGGTHGVREYMTLKFVVEGTPA